jgi:hypothetical protein
MLDKLKAIAQSPSGRRFRLITDLMALVAVLAMVFGLEMPWYLRVLGGVAATTLALGLLLSLPKTS